MNNSTLTAEQRAQAEEFEQIIDDGQLGYIAIGLALMNIQDGQLHAGGFESYVERRFDMKVKQAYRTIRAAKVANRLKDAKLPPPKNEGQAHLLHEMLDEPDEQIEVWKQLLVEKKRPSMGDIKKFIRGWKKEKLGVHDDDSEGDIDMATSFYTPPIKVSPEANPVNCLDVAVQQLYAVVNIAEDDLGDISELLPRLEKAEQYLAMIKQALLPIKAAA